MSSLNDRRPVTIGLAATGLHVLHILEYCQAHGIDLDHLMAQKSPWTPRTLQWVERASRILGAPRVTVADMIMTGGRHTLDKDFALFDALTVPGRPLRIVSGTLQIPFLWFLIERYHDRIDSVVLVDEGLSTYAGPAGDRNNVPDLVQKLQLPELEQAFQAFADFPVTYYSRFPLTTQLRPQDRLEPVDRSVLPHLLRYDDVPTAPVIYFIGQPLHHLVTDPELDAALSSLAVHITRRLHPDTEVIYIPHRDEKPEKLAILTSLVDVRDLGYPIELEGLVSGVAPRRLATFCSTAAVSLGMIDSGVQVETFQLPKRLLKPEVVSAYEANGEVYAKFIGDQVIDHDLATGVVGDDGTILMPRGLLDEFLAAYKPEPGAAGRQHHPGWLPQVAYDDLPLADVTVVLGSDGEESLQPPEMAVDQAKAMIDFARALDPTAWVVYVPEPSESTEKREQLGALVEVEGRALPAELLPFEWGYRPRRVVTVRSSSFGALVAGGATGWALRPAQTGYDLEERAIVEAHRNFRAVPGADIRWERLPEPEIDPATALLATQRRHGRDELALRQRIVELEALLARSEADNLRRHFRIGNLKRRLDRRAKRIARLRNRIEAVEDRNQRLTARVRTLETGPRSLLRRAAGRLRRQLREARARSAAARKS